VTTSKLQWLLGHWEQAADTPKWFAMTWTMTPAGLEGVLEEIEKDRTRATVAVYFIEVADEQVKLTWIHRWGERGPDVFRGTIDKEQKLLQVFWDREASDPATRPKDAPLLIQFTVDGETLHWEEQFRALGIPGRWRSYREFRRGGGRRFQP
jgi:hypothetical protein